MVTRYAGENRVRKLQYFYLTIIKNLPIDLDGGVPVGDGRLRFWLAPYDEADDEYFIDAVSLTKTSTTCTLIGDANCDGVVNILDFQILSNNFGRISS